MLNPSEQLAKRAIKQQELTPMQAITTKFIPATNTRGSRVKATAQAGSVTLNWDHALNSDDNHRAAAMALVDKFSWYYGDWISGDLYDGSSVWVCFDKVAARINIAA